MELVTSANNMALQLNQEIQIQKLWERTNVLSI